MKNIRAPWLFAKTLAFFLLANLLFALITPPVGKISGYNWLFPGRERLPFGAGASDLNISVDDLNALFASHKISQAKQPGEYRVLLLGDSSIWGELLQPQETLAAALQNSVACPGRTLRFYNLGYPHPSVQKDLLFLQEAQKHQPDLILWALTPFSLTPKAPNPLLLQNFEQVLALTAQYSLPYDYANAQAPRSLYQKSIVGQRDSLARMALLQALGIAWGATGKDTAPLTAYPPLSPDVKGSLAFGGFDAPQDLSQTFLWSYLEAGVQMNPHTPILFFNEPIFVASGKNSDVRYNAMYPRWAYDQYRSLLRQTAQTQGWQYVDVWDIIPPQGFTDNPLHLSAQGESLLAAALQPYIQQNACP